MAVNLEDVEALPVAGVKATYIEALADGHKCAINNGRTALHIKNGGGGSTTLTIKGGMGKGGRYYADRTQAIADGEEWFFQFQDTDDRGGSDIGKAEFTFSVITSVTFALLNLT